MALFERCWIRLTKAHEETDSCFNSITFKRRKFELPVELIPFCFCDPLVSEGPGKKYMESISLYTKFP